MTSRRRNREGLPVKTVILAVTAAVVLIFAVFVVLRVINKIRTDYNSLDEPAAVRTEAATTEEAQEEYGWIMTGEGYRYRFEDGSFAKDSWEEIDGLLYRFDEDGYMYEGEWKEEGQIFTCSPKGYLKDIQPDFSYVPDETGEELDSLVKVGTFWCYLGESEGPFKPILYRKATDQQVMTLGGETAPERSTSNSLKAYGDYLYYLPKVQESQAGDLSQEELELCDTLFRVLPGSGEKEMIAEDVGGFIVLGDVIYYSQNSHIYSAQSGTAMAMGGGQITVKIEEGECYLVDSAGQPAKGDGSGYVSIGDRLYRLDRSGRVLEVRHGQETVDGYTYSLKTVSGNKQAVFRKGAGGSEAVAQGEYGVQSYCIAGQKLYYCAYVYQDGQWYSQIFASGLDGSGKSAVSVVFPGTMGNLYYYEDSGEIYGEYYPEIWNSAYGKIAAVTLNGAIYVLDDEEARSGETVSGNHMLELVMVNGTDVTCLWNDLIWTKGAGESNVRWSKAIELKSTERTLLEGTEPAPKESPSQPPETTAEVIIQPVESPESQETVSPNADKPTLPPSAAAPTAAPTTEEEVKIVPIG